MKKWAVEGKIYDNGRVEYTRRLAEKGEKSYNKECKDYDLWVDVSDDKELIDSIYNEYKEADKKRGTKSWREV